MTTVHIGIRVIHFWIRSEFICKFYISVSFSMTKITYVIVPMNLAVVCMLLKYCGTVSQLIIWLILLPCNGISWHEIVFILLGWIKSFAIFWYFLVCGVCVTWPKHFEPRKMPARVGSIVILDALTHCT